MKNKTMTIPKSHFKIFKHEVERLIDVLGLKEWNVEIAFEEFGTSESCPNAEIKWNSKSRCVKFRYNRKIIDAHRKMIIPPLICAKHEIGHLLMAEMEEIATARYVADYEVDAASEKFATLISKVL